MQDFTCESQYVVISLFDGAGYTRKVVEGVFKQKPLAIITAENDFALRRFVAQK